MAYTPEQIEEELSRVRAQNPTYWDTAITPPKPNMFGEALKRVSRGVDWAFEQTGLPQLGAELGAEVGKPLGPTYEAVGAQVGEGFPRMLAEFAGLGATSWPLRVAGVASPGLKAYEQTGSPIAGLISSASMATLPGSAKIGSELATAGVAKAFPALATEASAPLEKLAAFFGGAGGMTVNQELAKAGTSLAMGQAMENPLTGENLFAQALGLLPTLAHPGIVKDLFSGKPQARTPMMEIMKTPDIRSPADVVRIDKALAEQEKAVTEAAKTVNDVIIESENKAVVQRVADEKVAVEEKAPISTPLPGTLPTTTFGPTIAINPIRGVERPVADPARQAILNATFGPTFKPAEVPPAQMELPLGQPMTPEQVSKLPANQKLMGDPIPREESLHEKQMRLEAERSGENAQLAKSGQIAGKPSATFKEPGPRGASPRAQEAPGLSPKGMDKIAEESIQLPELSQAVDGVEAVVATAPVRTAEQGKNVYAFFNEAMAKVRKSLTVAGSVEPQEIQNYISAIDKRTGQINDATLSAKFLQMAQKNSFANMDQVVADFVTSTRYDMLRAINKARLDNLPAYTPEPSDLQMSARRAQENLSLLSPEQQVALTRAHSSAPNWTDTAIVNGQQDRVAVYLAASAKGDTVLADSLTTVLKPDGTVNENRSIKGTIENFIKSTMAEHQLSREQVINDPLLFEKVIKSMSGRLAKSIQGSISKELVTPSTPGDLTQGEILAKIGQKPVVGIEESAELGTTGHKEAIVGKALEEGAFSEEQVGRVREEGEGPTVETSPKESHWLTRAMNLFDEVDPRSRARLDATILSHKPRQFYGPAGSTPEQTNALWVKRVRAAIDYIKLIDPSTVFTDPYSKRVSGRVTQGISQSILDDLGIQRIGNIGTKDEAAKNIVRDVFIELGFTPSEGRKQAFIGERTEGKVVTDEGTFTPGNLPEMSSAATPKGESVDQFLLRVKDVLNPRKEQLTAKAWAANKDIMMGGDVISVHNLLDKIFSAKGIEPELKERYISIAERMVASIRGADGVKIGGVSQDMYRTARNTFATFGTAIPPGVKMGNITTAGDIIGIAQNIAARGGNTLSSKHLDAFYTMATLGHELMHTHMHVMKRTLAGTTGEAQRKYTDMLQHATNLSVDQRRGILFELAKVMIPKKFLYDKDGNLDKSYNLDYLASSPNEFLAGYGEMMYLGMASAAEKGTSLVGKQREFSAKTHEALLQSTPEEANFILGHFKDLSTMTEAIMESVRQNLPVVQHWVGSDTTKTHISRTIRELHELVRDTVYKNQESVSEYLDYARSMSSALSENQWFRSVGTGELPDFTMKQKLSMEERRLGPEATGIFDAAKDALGIGKNPPEGNLGDKASILDYWIPMPQFAERHPIAAKFIFKMINAQNLASRFMTTMAAPLLVESKGGKMVPSKNNIIEVIGKDPKLRQAFSDIALKQDETKGMLDDKARRDLMPRLTPDEQNNVIQGINTTLEMRRNSVGLIIKGEQHKIACLLGRVFMQKNKSMLSETALERGNSLVEAKLLQDKIADDVAQGLPPSVDPRMIDVLTAKAFEGIDPNTMGVYEDLASTLTQGLTKLTNNLSERSWSFSESRPGKYFVRFKRDGKSGGVGAMNEKEVASIIEGLRSDPSVDQSSIMPVNKFEQMGRFATVHEDVVKVFSELESAAFERLLKDLPYDMARKIGDSYQPGAAVMEEVHSRGMARYLAQQKLKPGRETLNMLEVQMDYFQGLAKGLAKRYMRDEGGLTLLDPEMVQNPSIRNLMEQWGNAVLSPQSKEFTMTKNIATAYYMAGNISSMMVEGVQTLQTFIPFLTHEGCGIGEGYLRLGRTATRLASAVASAKGGKDLDFGRTDTNAAYKKMQSSELTSYGIFQELRYDEDLLATNLKRVANGEFSNLDIATMLKNPVYQGIKIGQSLFKVASETNAKLTALTAFEYARDVKKLDFDAAYAFADRAVKVTMYAGGSAARPLSITMAGKATPYLGLLYTLQGYTAGTIGMLSRYGKESLGLSGLRGKELHDSQKAFAQMLGTNFALGGALGMPFVGAAIALLEQIFPDMELKKGIRETVSKLGGADQEMGNLVGEFALYGLPSAGLNMDVSSRVQMGAPFGVNSFNGFDAKQILGAPGSIIGNMVKAGTQVSQGDVAQATQTLAPTFLKNIIDITRNQGKIYDNKGELLFEPGAASNIARAIGFRSLELRQLQEQQSMMRQSDDIANRARRKEYESLADALIKGNPELVRQTLMNQEMSDSNFDARAALHQIVEIAYDKTVPADVLEKASTADLEGRRTIAAIFPQRPRRSEVEKVTTRRALEQSVGIPGAGAMSSREMTRAQMIDNLIQMNPYMSRTEALKIVEKQL